MQPPPQADAIARLRAQWLRELPARAGLILEALRAIAPTASGELARVRARSLCHQLRGTAGSFGLVVVGEVAGQIEQVLGGSSPCEVTTARALADRLDEALGRETGPSP